MSWMPIVFTLPPSNRHEIILVDTTTRPTLKSLNKQITATLSTSPNCAEFMGKFKPKNAGAESIQEFRVHWSEFGRDRKVWPEYTIVTDENLDGVMELLRIGAGKDVLEIKVGREEKADEGKKEGEKQKEEKE